MRMWFYLPLLLVAVLSITGQSQGSATITLAHSTPDTVDVMMTNTIPVAGVQFNLSGASISGMSGGSSAAANWLVQSGPTGVVLMVSFSLTTVPASATETLLARLSLVPPTASIPPCPLPCPPNQVCISGIVVSSVQGLAIPSNSIDCIMPTTITLGAPPAPGVVLPIMLSSPDDVGAFYVCVLTLSPYPGTPLSGSDNRVVPISNDWLLAASLNAPGAFFGNIGYLSLGMGDATATLIIPPIPSLAGFSFFAAFVTTSPTSSSGIGSFSAAVPITL